MKILHTADWHIGKRLHNYDLDQDFNLFVDWVINLIAEKNIEVVLVSGDIFDLANPSSQSRKTYFQTLLKLKEFDCKVIMTGGNHDSPAVLNGPKDLLNAMDIHVVGSMPADYTECLVPLSDKTGKTKALVAAIPYLRDPDLRKATVDHSYETRTQEIKEGIKGVFAEVADKAQIQYPGVPAIAMGHLFATGVSTSESEREIQIGNLASFDASDFGDYFQYVALGHIHKPQKVSGPSPTFYSGSPIPLSFSERDDQKRVLVLDTDDFHVESVEVPAFRNLRKVSGTLEELRVKLPAFKPEGDLESLLEVTLVEEDYNPSHILDLDRLIQETQIEGATVVKSRVEFKNRVHGTAEIFQEGTQLEDLKPREVFENRLQAEQFDEETEKLLREAFEEILEETLNPGQNEN